MNVTLVVWQKVNRILEESSIIIITVDFQLYMVRLVINGRDIN